MGPPDLQTAPEKTRFQVVLTAKNGSLRRTGQHFGTVLEADTHAKDELDKDPLAVEAFVCIVYSAYRKDHTITKTL